MRLRYLKAVPQARIIDVDKLDLPDKGDCVDWLAANPDSGAAEIEALPCIDFNATTKEELKETNERDKQSPISTSALLVDLTLHETSDLWHDPNGTAYATIGVGEHREQWLLRSRTFKSWLAHLLWQAGGRAAPSQAMQDALAVLEGYAVHEGDQHEVHVRVAEHDGNVYLDLCDKEWRAVEVTTVGWKVISASPPVAFQAQEGYAGAARAPGKRQPG